MPNAGIGDCSSARAAHNCFGHFCLAWTVFRVPRHPHTTRRTPTESNLSRLTRDLLRNELRARDGETDTISVTR